MIKEAIRELVFDQVFVKGITQVRILIYDLTNNQVEKQLKDQLREQTRDQVEDQIWDQVFRKIIDKMTK